MISLLKFIKSMFIFSLYVIIGLNINGSEYSLFYLILGGFYFSNKISDWAGRILDA